MTGYGRITAVDAFKGIAIIGVVVSHTFYCLSKSEYGGPATISTVLANIAFSALMLFFVFSGYFCKVDKSYRENIIRRIIQLGFGIVILQIVLPLIVAAIGMIAGNQDINYDLLWKSTVGMVVGPFFCENIGWFQADYINELYVCTRIYYFIQMMLVGFIVFYAIARKCYEDTRLAVVSIVVCIIVECLFSYLGLRLPLYAESAPMAIAFMLLGLLMKRYNFLEKMEEGCKNARYWFISIVMIAVAAAIFWFCPIGMHFIAFRFGNDGWISVIPFFAGTLCAALGLLRASMALTYVPTVRDKLAFLGKYTLCVYLLHNFFIRAGLAVYSGPADSIFIPNNLQTFPEALFYFIFALVASLAIGMVLEKMGKNVGSNKPTEQTVS